MNILYIGPYRLANNAGLESTNLLYNLMELGHNITARSVFDGTNPIKDKEIISVFENIEQNKYSKFDLLIQHLPISRIVKTSKIKNNIYWPILDNTGLSPIEKKKCELISQDGLLIYSTNSDKTILGTCNISNLMKLNYIINDKLLSKNSSIFNFGIYNRHKKYYTIVDATMEYTIQNLIINFVTKFQNKDYCLVVFLPNTTQNLLDQYQKYIKEIYTIFDINFSINKILIVPIDHNVDALVSAHKTGDIYISLKDNIQTILSSSLGKNIIYYKSEPILSYEKNNLKKYGTIEYKEKLDLDQPSIIKNIDNLKEIIGRYAQ
jgi:predicted transcriptional regulator